MKFKYILGIQLSVFAAHMGLADSRADGNYNVPVQEESLSDSSNYNTEYKYRDNDGEITRFKYDLPLELTGESNKIDISYTGDAEFPWSGEVAKGDCSDVEGTFKCNLIYTKEKLTLDPVKTEEVIRRNFAGNESEIQRRLQVAEIFRSEPAGITSFYR